MTYAVTNPPRLIEQMITGSRFWSYESADPMATVDGSGYFTNGYVLGMRDGDLIKVYDTGNKIWSMHTVLVSGTTVNLSDGTVIGSATSSD